MREYLVYHGGHGSTVEDPGLVSFMANGDMIEIRGDRRQTQKWARVMESSTAISSSMRNGGISFGRFITRNTYSSWTWFLEDKYEQYKDLFESVKGETIVVKIDPNRGR